VEGIEARGEGRGDERASREPDATIDRSGEEERARARFKRGPERARPACIATRAEGERRGSAREANASGRNEAARVANDARGIEG